MGVWLTSMRSSWRAREGTIIALVAATAFLSAAWFFQGGGSNQGAHLATVVALIEDRSLHLDRYRGATGDLSRVPGHVVSAKPIATALAAVPGYLAARIVTAKMKNQGDRLIIRGYLTTVLCAGAAFAALAAVLYTVFRRRLPPPDAATLSLAMTVATPLFPNSTMLTSHPLAALAAILCLAILYKAGASQTPPSPERLFGAGACAGLAVCFEYQAALAVAPLFGYAVFLARPRWRAVWFVLGGLLLAVIPATHHQLLYGSPFSTGYSSLVNPTFVNDAKRGFMGFDPSEFSFFKLYDLTFGSSRGYFFLSPFLVAALPGWVRLMRERRTRPEGLATFGAAWIVLVSVSILTYWHSGNAAGSRYALLFVAFCALPIGAVYRDHRGWIAVGIAIAFCIMLMGTSVSAMAPQNPPDNNVLRWWWDLFIKGGLTFWRSPVIHITGIGDGQPTLPSAFNLGQLMGLPGHWSLAPYLAALGALGVALWRCTKAAAASIDSRTP